jgi:hypothetical protein
MYDGCGQVEIDFALNGATLLQILLEDISAASRALDGEIVRYDKAFRSQTIYK